MIRNKNIILGISYNFLNKISIYLFVIYLIGLSVLLWNSHDKWSSSLKSPLKVSKMEDKINFHA